jgi:hypothetical protein
MRATTILSFTAILLLGANARAQATAGGTSVKRCTKSSGFELRYHDDTGAFTLCKANEWPGNCTHVPFVPNRESVALVVDAAPCGYAFRWQVTERELADTEAEVRGLDEIAGLMSVVVPGGVKKGVAPLEGLTVTPRDLLQVVDLLATAEGPGQLAIEIRAEWSAFQTTLRDLRYKACTYTCFETRFLKELTQAPLNLQCELEELLPQGAGSVPCPGKRSHPSPSQGVDACQPLRDRADQINRVLPRFEAARTLLVSDPLAAAPPVLEESVAAFQLRLSVFESKVQAVRSALKLLDGWGTALRGELRLRMIKRLQETFKDVPAIAASEIVELADRASDLETSTRPMAEVYRDQREELSTLAARYLPGSEPCSPPAPPEACVACCEKDASDVRQPCGETDTGRHIVLCVNDICQLRQAADAVLLCTRDALNELDREVRRLNTLLRQAVARLQADLAETRRPLQVDVIGPWSKNAVVNVKVFRRWAVHMPDLSALDSTVTTQEARTDASKEALPPEFAEVAARTFEVHVLYRYGVGAGPFLSGVGDRDYSVREYLRLDGFGQPVLGPDGQPIYDKKLVETGHDNTTLGFAVFFNVYLPGKFDSFPSRADRVAWGLTLGVPFTNPSKSALLGAFLQPTLGCQIAVGLHRGQRTAPEAGIVPGETVLPPDTTTPPTTEETITRGFISVILDSHFFKKLFGGG